MTEELKKQAIAEDAAVAETVEETGATPGLDEAAKAAEREARRQALYEENERAEDERARAEAERMRDVDDEDETRDAAVLIIAQRISTILHADQIVVLKDGEIVGLGTHDELMETCEVYRAIAESQMKGGE